MIILQRGFFMIFDIVFFMFLIFQVKHFLADYILQTGWMLKKGRKKIKDWFFPLLAHASVHGLLTFFIVSLFTFDFSFSFAMGFVDLNLHFIMDRVKASPYLLGRFKSPNDKKFWISLGFDQMVHHICTAAIIVEVCRYMVGGGV